jgi:hypothetical protein
MTYSRVTERDAMSWVRPSITASGDSIGIRKGFSNSLFNISDIASIEVTKIGKITYDELFLILNFLDGSSVNLGELDNGFNEAELFLRNRLDGFPPGWQAVADKLPLNYRNLIWVRSKGSP